MSNRALLGFIWRLADSLLNTCQIIYELAGQSVMNRESQGSLLSTVFIDYDNIYLSLKRKSDEAAKRFAKNAGGWLQAIASGALITPTNGPDLGMPRRIVMNRCYGNSFPRRNPQDDATDMNSFPFVRHHFVRAGCEVIDCPPLTKQLKNSADIRMVMDVRDYLLHDTYFDEFVILSGDADFTPVLHRLRQHARRTVVYANDYTVAPYRAISDGEIREADLIKLLLDGAPNAQVEGNTPVNAPKGLPSPASLATARSEILNEVLTTVQRAQQPVPLEALADRAVRILGHEKTVGLAWGGAGSFRDLLANGLPSEVRLSDAAPYFVYDTTRQSAPQPLRAETRDEPRTLPSPDAVREAQATLVRTDENLEWNRTLATEPAVLSGQTQNGQAQPGQAQPGNAQTGSAQTGVAQPVRRQVEAPQNGSGYRQTAEVNEAAYGSDTLSHPSTQEARLEAPSVYAPSRSPQPALMAPQGQAAQHDAPQAHAAPQPAPQLHAGRSDGHRIEPTLGAAEPNVAAPQVGQPTARANPADGPSPLTSGVVSRSLDHGQPLRGTVEAGTMEARSYGQPLPHHNQSPLAQPITQSPTQSGGAGVSQGHPAGREGSLPRAEQGAAPSTPAPQRQADRNPSAQHPGSAAQAASGPAASQQGRETTAGALQAAIARIHEACQAPPLSPPDYRVLFQVMAEEITANGLTGSATLVNIAQRAQDNGVEVRRDDVRFVLEVVSEADPWFEQGASAALFASRFRNFVLARCRSQGLQLSADELDLIEAWFSSGAPRGGGPANRRSTAGAEPAGSPQAAGPPQTQQPVAQTAGAPQGRAQAAPADGASDGRWFGSASPGMSTAADPANHDDDFPRILQKRAGG
ncbi:MAG: NYN domain-containing protein [Pseudomonadota bacterium]